MVYRQPLPCFVRVIRATSDFSRVFEIEVSTHMGPSGVSIERSDR